MKLTPISDPVAALSNVALALPPATSATPLGVPAPVPVLKPVSTAVVVPSNALVTLGNTSIRAFRAAPSVSTKRVEKSVGAA